MQFQVKYLTEALAKRGVELFLLSYSNGQEFLDKTDKGFPRFVKLTHGDPVLGTIELYRAIKEISPCIIHVHSAGQQALQLAVLKSLGLIKQPFIVTSHGIDIMTQPEIGYGLRIKPINAWLIKFVLEKCARHIIVGRSMREFALEAGSDPEKVIEINNGVPLTYKEIPKARFDYVLRKYKIAPEDRVLLSLSGMRPLKGIEYLVKALPEVLRKFPEAKLVLACESGGYERSIRDLVKDLGLESHVRFIGFVTKEEEKIILIRRCDVFCKPSLLEACSVAILEAMREGRVVVASVPGGIDIVADRKSGLLARVKDPQDYADKVIEVLSNGDLRKEIERNARRAIKNFDIKKIGWRHVALYEEVTQRNPD